MALRLRFLLDTNILIPLQDPFQILEPNLAEFVRIANAAGHQLLYHPASIKDFQRDPDLSRKARNLQRITQYTKLENPAPCPWNDSNTSANDACDNEILYALQCDAVHALVTEDKGIHAKARALGLQSSIYTIQTAEDWLRRLHGSKQIELPNIEDVPLHHLTPLLSLDFFSSLRDGYAGFDDWFRTKAREARRAWIYRDEREPLSAICIYTVQVDEPFNNQQDRLPGQALKLCTFKVGETVRGRKIGELFLKAAFRYASENTCEHIFIHANSEKHEYLNRLLQDFGFEARGSYHGDVVFVKAHPRLPPAHSDLAPLPYAKKYFPHFRRDEEVHKFIVPIQSQYHEILFPDYVPQQRRLFGAQSNTGNAIKLAYLCHAPTKSIAEGDIVLFYRTGDEKAITTIGVVDRFEVLQDAAKIASLVSRRTVYSPEEIELMARKPTKVILFRMVEHLHCPVGYDQLLREGVVRGPIQSITRVQDVSFFKILSAGGW